MSDVSNGGSRPRLLDLFCGAGGAAVGYARAGFEVVGVDIKPQPNYPFEFHQSDALEFLDALWDHEGGVYGDFAAIHASPPCQAFTTMSNRWRGKGGKADAHINLIPETREYLTGIGLPYVIENVPGAKAWLRNPVAINGASVGLPRVHRRRLFETNWILLVPESVRSVDTIAAYGKAPDGRLLWKRKDGSEQRAPRLLAEVSEEMGVPWMTWDELAESIPPAYTELIGEQLYSWLQAGTRDLERAYGL